MKEQSKIEEKVSHAQENNRVLRWMTRLGFVMILTAAAISFWFFYQAFFPQRVTIIEQEEKNIPAKVNKQEVRTGEPISFTVNYCKFEDYPSILSIGFIDGTLAATFNAISHFPLGCKEGTYQLIVPQGLKPDEYYIEVTLKYDKGLLREETHLFRTEKFRVVQ